MITVTIKKTGLLRKAWRMKIVAENGEPLPHQYNRAQTAQATARLMFGTKPSGSIEPAKMVTILEDGTRTVEELR